MHISAVPNKLSGYYIELKVYLYTVKPHIREPPSTEWV